MEERKDSLGDNMTPAVAAALEAMVSLEDIWIELWKLGSQEDLMRLLVGPMFGNPDLSGVGMSQILESVMDADEAELVSELEGALPHDREKDGKSLPPNIVKVRFTELAMFETASTFVVQTMRAYESRAEEATQWVYACEAKRYLGMLQGYIWANRQPSPISALAKRAADARHKENREMKKDAFDWLNANFERFKSMDEAADAVREVVPVKFRTAREWVGHWKKAMAENKE